ncbi:MAG: FkbM family methyltransferase [Acidimicrobiales bacterium]
MADLDDLWVVVVEWRSGHTAAGLVTHLLDTWPAVKVVVVSCGGTFPGWAHPRLTVLATPNLGYAGGNNAGFRIALDQGARWVLVLNSDAYPLPGSLERLVRTAASLPGAALCGAGLVNWSYGVLEVNCGTSFDWMSGSTAPAPVPEAGAAVPFPCGAMALFRGEALETVGGFDANLFLYYEEIDWCERARAAGFEVTVDPGARGLHLGARSTARAAKAVTYYSARNRLWVLRRYSQAHGIQLSGTCQALAVSRALGSLVRGGQVNLVAPYLLGASAGLGPVPPVADSDEVAISQQRWETRDASNVGRRSKGTFPRVRAWLDQDELAERPLRVVVRRAQFEIERRAFPGRLVEDRPALLDGDLRMWVRLSDDIERNVFLLGLYDHRAARAFERLVPPGGTAVDVGAHVGQFSLLAARAAGPTGAVVAFEPQPLIRERLGRNIEANSLGNVDVLACALSDHAGVRPFHATENQANSGLASLCPSPSSCSFAHVEVETDTLDHVLHTRGVSRVDVVKIDVEGEEAGVLLGARRVLEEHRPAVLFEANDALGGPPMTSAAIEVLRGMGYDFFVPGPSDGEQPNLVACEDLEVLASLTSSGRPQNLIALHPGSPNASLARRWVAQFP